MREGYSDFIEVGMAQFAAATAPTRVISYSLGSCVALVLYDRRVCVGGLAHVMLPGSSSQQCSLPAKFASHALDALVAEMEKLGARRFRLTARLIGGASLFNNRNGSSAPSMGERNATALRERLTQARIRLVAEDTGGDFARTVTLTTEDGAVKIRTAARGEYEL
ncbi:MAG: chemotaxis protein CheD [Armatimonadetes bacterium]|nr:chemotaxis protein CheD [Armatimonadota bacterium]PIU67197.1 MAG: chemotaxis protein CheD [Armatimonadetes bacterium CG07_land_8_20_14_0_80_59_28]PIX39268.1 MAG: chemotaxis protein CheD [Armatimonadetes bacterium CG_4_8_14_3_um_filter_58_9]